MRWLMLFLSLLLVTSCDGILAKPTQDVTVIWNYEYPPSADGFYLYAGFKSGKYVNYIDLGYPRVDTGENPGHHEFKTCVSVNPRYNYFAMRAYNIKGLSPFSEEAVLHPEAPKLQWGGGYSEDTIRDPVDKEDGSMELPGVDEVAKAGTEVREPVRNVSSAVQVERASCTSETSLPR